MQTFCGFCNNITLNLEDRCLCLTLYVHEQVLWTTLELCELALEHRNQSFRNYSAAGYVMLALYSPDLSHRISYISAPYVLNFSYLSVFIGFSGEPAGG